MSPNSPASIVLDDPNRPVDAAVLDTPGGFVWWYADSIDDNGDGFVLIWSFGLPFLPGLLSSARGGQPVPPRQHPALNLVWYRGGKEAFYLLQTYDEADASWSGGTFRFGRSTIEVTRDGPVHRVEAALDCDVPRSQHALKGHIRVVGPATSISSAPAPSLEHAWAPLIGPGVARASLEHGAHRFSHVGRAYHDRNVGHAPLDQLGIGRWSWGRTVSPSQTKAHYVVWNDEDEIDTAWLVDIGRDGRIEVEEDVAVTDGGRRRARYGVTTPARLSLEGASGTRACEEVAVVDDGPFYLRALYAEADGTVGIAEHVVPDRIDLGLHRPLVRMRVHDTHGPTSFWLPLFSGPDRGRWARLLGFEEQRP